MIQETIFPFKLELTKEVLTARSGLALFAQYNHKIGLRELVTPSLAMGLELRPEIDKYFSQFK